MGFLHCSICSPYGEIKKLWNTSLVPMQWVKPHDATKMPQLLCVKLEDPKNFTSQALRRSRAVIHLVFASASVRRNACLVRPTAKWRSGQSVFFGGERAPSSAICITECQASHCAPARVGGCAHACALPPPPHHHRMINCLNVARVCSYRLCIGCAGRAFTLTQRHHVCSWTNTLTRDHH